MYNPPQGELHGPFIITEINNEWVGYEKGNGFSELFINQPRLPLEWCEPITLTEEWLMRLGLANGKEIFRGLTIWQNRVRDGSGNYDGYHFSTTRADLNYRFVLGFCVKTVHHLQNFYYCFTGQELIIKQ